MRYLALALCISGMPLSAWSATSFFVKPHDIDAKYAANDDSHFVATNASVTSNGTLLVFLPGTGAETRNYKLFPELAADLGFHAIGLAYPNGPPTMAALCALSADTGCYEKAHKEVCFGIDAHPDLDVDSLNSIEGRLGKLLRYLDDRYPKAGWGQFVNASGPAWGKIAVSGHSQGSGHALYLGHAKSCDRVIMFAGADDFSARFDRAADWVPAPSVTPVSRVFSFLHDRDDVAPYSKQLIVLKATGIMAGGDDSTSVDGKAAPFGKSHCLYTDLDPAPLNGNGSTHSGMVADVYTPKNGGKPVYQPVWTYLLTADAGVTTELRTGKPRTRRDGKGPVPRFPSGARTVDAEGRLAP